MKQFTRVEPAVTQEFGLKYKQQAVIKRFKTDDGLQHEFTTVYAEGSRAAAVIALTPENHVITVFQFRAGPEEWIYDLPGGGVNAGEDIEVGALRELKEETGYVPGKMELLGKSYGDGYTNILFHYYFATDCMLEENGRSLDAEEHEQGAEVRLLTIDEFIKKAKYEGMTDAHAVLMAYEKLKTRTI